MRNSFRHLLFIGIVGCLVSFMLPVSQVSMKMTARILKDGKSITATGELYYKVTGGGMVTRFLTPSEYLVMTNSNGEFSIYNNKDNTVTQAQGRDYSSENSFIYYFLRNKTQDMGLGSSGFQLKDTKFEDNLMITTWNPPAELAGSMTRAELVQENYRPIFMGFYNDKGKPIQKVYYSKYEKVGDYSVPMSITEFQYLAKGDSIITKRVYSDVKINDQVNSQWLNFRIPNNAKVIK